MTEIGRQLTARLIVEIEGTPHTVLATARFDPVYTSHKTEQTADGITLTATLDGDHLGKQIEELIGSYVDSLTAAEPEPEPTSCPSHKPVQHRDGKPPWCNACGYAEQASAPEPEPCKHATRSYTRGAYPECVDCGMVLGGTRAACGHGTVRIDYRGKRCLDCGARAPLNAELPEHCTPIAP